MPSRPRRNTRPRDELGRPLPYGSLGFDPGSLEPPSSAVDSLNQAQQLLDAGLPFHAHEVLEDAWKIAPAAERDLWQGLAQLAVGMTHAARGNRSGAATLLDRGARLIAPYASAAPHRVDVLGLCDWARASSEHIAEDSRSEPLQFVVPRLMRPVD